jgi:plasmid stabilization system protein ParE
MLDVVFGDEAERELDAAAEEYGTFSSVVRERFLDRAERALLRCRQFPESAPEFCPGMRKIALNPFPMFMLYRISSETIDVVGVFDARRDPDVLLGIVDTR